MEKPYIIIYTSLGTPGIMKVKYLNVAHWNTNKHTSLVAHLTQGSPDVIIFTSTSRTREQGPIKIPFYNTFTTNKTNTLHAGSGIAIKMGIQFELLNQFHHDTIGAKINSESGPLIVMTSYAPPRQNHLPNQDLEFMMRHELPAIFAGDLNCRHRHFGYNTGPNAKGRSMYSHIFNNRIQHLGPIFPTFYTRFAETRPDIVLANNNFYLNHNIQSGGIGPSDHITLDITISANAITTQIPPFLDTKNTDWDGYKTNLTRMPEANYNGKNIDDLGNGFHDLYNRINEAKEESTPLKTSIRKNNLHTTTKFKRLTKILDRYYQMLVTNGKNEHLDRSIRNTQLMLVQEGNECKQLWWQQQIEKVELAAKCNTKFWRRIKLLSGKKSCATPPLKYKENNIDKTAKTDEEKTNLFTKTLSKTCTISNEDNQQFCHETERMVKATLERNINKITPIQVINLQNIRDPRTNKLPFDNLDIVNSIKSLKDRTPGTSGLRKPYFSNLPPNVISNICHMFNCCYASGVYPEQFKTAEVVMIPKNNTPTTDPEKYRPISLLNFLGKVFAKILNQKLIKHLEDNNFLMDSQHGFRKRRGTATLLANLYERIAREKGTETQ